MFGKERGYREKPAYGIAKRLRRSLLSIFSRWHRKGYDVRYVYINKKQYKKIIFRTEAMANRVHADLKAFGPSRHFPAVVGKQWSTIWVEFVKGSTIRKVDENSLPLLADLYAAIYRRHSRLVVLRETLAWHDFYRDLGFLNEIKILNDQPYRELIDHSHEIIPERVWVGFDYRDPITANLVLRKNEDAICAIDIKNIYSETLIGRGIAKARSRWLSDALAGSFFEQLTSKGAPDFRGYLPFLEMLHQVTRAKSMVLEGQIKSLQPIKFNQGFDKLILQARTACREQTQPSDERLDHAGNHVPIDATGHPARWP